MHTSRSRLWIQEDLMGTTLGGSTNAGPRLARRLACLVLAQTVLSALADGVAGAPPAPADAREVAARFLRAPSLPPLTLGERRPGTANTAQGGGAAFSVFTLIGRDGRDAGFVAVDAQMPAVSSLYLVRSYNDPLGVNVLEPEELLRRACDLAEFAREQSAVAGHLALESVRPLDADGDVRLTFRLLEVVGRARVWLPFAITLTIGAVSGVATECSVFRGDVALARASLPDEVGMREAWLAAANAIGIDEGAMAATDVSWKGPVPAADGRLPHNWSMMAYPSSVDPSADAEAMCADIDLGGAPPTVAVHRITAAYLKAWIALGGAIWQSQHPDEYLRAQLQPKADLRDAWPIWDTGGRGLLLISVRPRPRAAFWNRLPGVMLTSNEGRVFYVLPSGRGVVETGASAADVAAATTTAGRLLLVNLRTGVWAQRGVLQETTYHDVSLSPDGSSLVYAAFRRQGDRDIFVDGLDPETLAERDHLRICRLEGDDRHPLFSPDGRQVYFAHCDPGAATKGEEWAVYRVPPDKQYWENTPPEPVVGGFGAIGRLSFFPDGRLLVSHDKGLDVVDVEAKTRTPLGLPELRDSLLPADRPALKLRDPAVSPDGKKLAFSALRDSGDPQNGTGWYIYTCNLDGSDVKRVTPLADDPVEPYVFPGTGKTAFDVAREMEEDAAKRAQGVQ
jgi:hypothetical protein